MGTRELLSSLHATLVTLLSAYALAFEEPCGVTRLDAISMPIYWRDVNLLVFWLHHGGEWRLFVLDLTLSDLAMRYYGNF
uniref:Secreted protein n=1 Tax=Macrostomum lignano TaxID=282301 RepID=A0A1I8FAI3_9PLAT